MTQKDCFIKIFDSLLADSGFQKILDSLDSEVTEKGMIYFQNLKNQNEQSELTENGKKILSYLQTLTEDTKKQAKEIGVELFMSSRSVSGTMRKLVTDGYVEKYATSPISYAITPKGREFKI